MSRDYAYRHGRVALWFTALSLSAACTGGNPDFSEALPPDVMTPSDPCQVQACANGGICRFDGSVALCDCPAGFTGALCEVNINDCPADACENGGTCVDGVGSYTCACPPGIAGDRCEIDLDLRLTVPRRMINDKSLSLRAEMLDPDTGNIVTDGCYDTLGNVTVTSASDGTVIPSTVVIFDDHVPVPDDSIRFYHGVGSVSLTLDGGAAVPAGEYWVTVTVGQRTAKRRLTVESSPTWRVMPPALSGADLVWGPNENIRLSSHQTIVPAGETLTIHPGTLIMVDTTGGYEDGTLLVVNGKMAAAGTIEQPIHFFSTRGAAAMTHTLSGRSLSNPNSWRGIFFYGDQTSNMDWVVLSGAGNGPLAGHPRPPILNLANKHNLTVHDSVLVDATGMMFQSPGTGTTTIRRTLVSRVGIGAEFLSSGNTVLIEDSWWTSIGRGPDTPLRYDGDGIHVDGAASKQTIRRSFVVDIGDDAIDHSNSTFTIEDTVIHDAADKAISMTNGLATIRNSLIFNAGSGVRGTARVYNSTIASPSPIANPQVLKDSIIWPYSLSSCAGDVSYSLLATGSDLSCGMGNFSMNPMFQDPASCNYRLAVGSPALTASSTGGPIGYSR
ncbi:MAG: hypothetical protein JNJ46_14985 [Myxococcales bacterium]|nr:hypothetical protein [Myxococcales bacterium]